MLHKYYMNNILYAASFFSQKFLTISYNDALIKIDD